MGSLKHKPSQVKCLTCSNIFFKHFCRPNKKYCSRECVYPLSVNERFYKKIRKTKKCWEWLGSKTKKGYGNFSIGQKQIRAHRFSYELYKTKIINDLHVLHRCDNPCCVKPSHLFLGTNKDNVKDSVMKDRRIKIPFKQVVRIRRAANCGAGISCVRLSLIFGVSQMTAWQIKNNKTRLYK